MRKKISLLLTFVMLFALLAVNLFADDEPSKWAVQSINDLKARGFLHQDLTYDYKEDITRKDFCKLAVYAYLKNKGYQDVTDLINAELKHDFKNYTYQFQDLDKNNQDDQYIFVANMLGFVDGVSANKFAPQQYLTREQAAKILLAVYSTMGQQEKLDYYKQLFADDHEISAWAKGYVYDIKEIGIMTGVGANKFSPKANYTREQAIITILKTINACQAHQKLTEDNQSKVKKLKREMINLINQERAKVGVAPVEECLEFEEYADIRASESAQVLGHTRPDGSRFYSGITGKFSLISENLSAGYTLPKTAMYHFMNSEKHKNNILNPAFKEVSIGYYSQKDSQYETYWIQLFSTK